MDKDNKLIWESIKHREQTGICKENMSTVTIFDEDGNDSKMYGNNRSQLIPDDELEEVLHGLEVHMNSSKDLSDYGASDGPRSGQVVSIAAAGEEKYRRVRWDGPPWMKGATVHEDWVDKYIDFSSSGRARSALNRLQ